MEIAVVIRGHELPGRCWPSLEGAGDNVHVGVQKKKDVVELRPADAAAVEWELTLELVTRADGALDFRGPYAQGKAGDRFLYLVWGNVGRAGALSMFRRAKLMLTAIPPEVLERARGGERLVAELGLTLANGTPVCAAVRPPRIRWFNE